MSKRFVRHDRPEIGAADADIDDITDAFAGVTFPLAAADALAEGRHLVQHGMDSRNYVLAVGLDHFTLRSSQGHVQDRALLRDVDLLSAKHGVDALAQAGLVRQLQQQLQRFVGDAVLGIVEKYANSFGGKTFASLRVIGEQFAEMDFRTCL